jgi:hypothetical protein
MQDCALAKQPSGLVVPGVKFLIRHQPYGQRLALRVCSKLVHAACVRCLVEPGVNYSTQQALASGVLRWCISCGTPCRAGVNCSTLFGLSAIAMPAAHY